MDDDEGIVPGFDSSVEPPTCECAIHITQDDTATIPLSSYDSWETIRKSAIIRDHEVQNVEIEPGDNYPRIFYHRLCYQYFTMKSKLDRISKYNEARDTIIEERFGRYNRSKEEKPEISHNDERPVRHSAVSEEALCMICLKKKYKDKKLEKLSPATNPETIEQLRKAAIASNDFRLLGHISQVRTRGFYHQTCKRNKVRSLEEIKAQPVTQNQSEIYAKEKSIKAVITSLSKLIMQPDVVPYSSIVRLVESTYQAENLNTPDNMKRNLRKDIERLMPEIKIISIDRSLYLYPKSINLESLVTQLVRARHDLNVYIQREEAQKKLTLQENEVVSAGKCIRREIKNMKDTMPWPPEVRDLGPDKFIIPHYLGCFMDSLLGKISATEVSPRASRIKLSLTQDIVYNVSRGKVKTPKSFLFPAVIKALTNNTELIKINNRLGHGMSLSMITEAQTERAYQIVESQLKNGCLIPDDCRPELFTILVADNIDRLEETLSGQGTTHKVNNLLIQFQYGAYGGDSTCNPPKRKRGRRSFEAIPPNQQSSYISGLRVGPGALSYLKMMKSYFSLLTGSEIIFFRPYFAIIAQHSPKQFQVGLVSV